MKILNQNKTIIDSKLIEHDKEKYRRNEYNDGSIIWFPISYDGDSEDENGDLEREYQCLFKSKSKKGDLK